MPRIPFANKKVNLNRAETLKEVFGNEPLKIGEMQKKLWSFIKQNNLMS